MDIPLEFRLRERRQAVSMTQAAAAAEIRKRFATNTHRKTIMRLENGDLEVTFPWLQMLAAIYGCEMTDLLPAEMTAPKADDTVRMVPVLASLSHASSMAAGPSQRNLKGLKLIPVVSKKPSLLAAVNDGPASDIGIPRGQVVIWSFRDKRPVAKKHFVVMVRGRIVCAEATKRGEQVFFNLKPHDIKPRLTLASATTILGLIIAAERRF